MGRKNDCITDGMCNFYVSVGKLWFPVRFGKNNVTVECDCSCVGCSL